MVGACFLVPDVPPHLATDKPENGKVEVSCYLCLQRVPLSRMRNHVGQHILFSMRDVPDEIDLHQEVSELARAHCP